MTDRTELVEKLRKYAGNRRTSVLFSEMLTDAADVIEKDRDRAAAGVGLAAQLRQELLRGMPTAMRDLLGRAANLLDPPAPPVEGHDAEPDLITAAELEAKRQGVYGAGGVRPALEAMARAVVALQHYEGLVAEQTEREEECRVGHIENPFHEWAAQAIRAHERGQA